MFNFFKRFFGSKVKTSQQPVQFENKFKPIPGYSRYECSREGTVRGVKGRLKPQYITKKNVSFYHIISDEGNRKVLSSNTIKNMTWN